MTRRPEVMLVPCTLEIAHTAGALHAHVTLDGVEVGPGDRVRVEDAPEFTGYGLSLWSRRTARVVRAGKLRRLWTRWSEFLSLLSLCEVGFSGRR